VKRPSLGLFERAALALAGPFLLAQAVMVAIFVWQVNLPLARSATEDLAALIVLAAQTWVELPPETRPDFQTELRHNHHLILAPAAGPLPGGETHLPYPALLQEALASRIGVESHLTQSVDPDMYWLDLPTSEVTLRIGFQHDRIGARPQRVLLAGLVAVLLASLATALLLARWLIRPLTRLARASEAIGHGELPAPLPETGPRELAALATRFNRMAREVRGLLDSRTALLAGVSHDLRTPLTRIRLSMAMLPGSTPADLVGDIERDIEQMEGLITQHLAYARGFAPEVAEPRDLVEVVGEAVANAERQGLAVDWRPPPPCVRPVQAGALARILGNLLENARLHARGRGVELRLETRPDRIRIGVLDRGPGVDPDEAETLFRPFQRSRHAREPGSGLGLAVVEQLAHSHGWTVTLGTRVGGGAEVWLELPGSAPGGNTL